MTAKSCLIYEQPHEYIFTCTASYFFVFALVHFASGSGFESSTTRLLTCYLIPRSSNVLAVASSSMIKNSYSGTSHPVAISVVPKNSQSANPTTTTTNTPIGYTPKTNIESLETRTSIRMDFETLVKPHAEWRVMFTVSASYICMVKPRILKGTYRLTFATHGMTDDFRTQPFHILISHTSAKAIQLPKQMVVAYFTGSPTFLVTVSSTLHHKHAMGIIKILVHSASCGKLFANCIRNLPITYSSNISKNSVLIVFPDLDAPNGVVYS